MESKGIIENFSKPLVSAGNHASLSNGGVNVKNGERDRREAVKPPPEKHQSSDQETPNSDRDL